MTKTGPRLSIGLPVYNGERFLEETLRSLLSQTYSQFELIISDNASTDGTEQICRAFAQADPRIRYYRNLKNIGLGPNFNETFGYATGKYFKWAAADDVCAPTFLARCLAVLDSDPSVVLVYARTRFIDQNGVSLDRHDPGWNLQQDPAHERFRYVMFSGHLVNSILGLIRADALRRTRLLPDYPGGDYALLGELSLLGKFLEIPDSLYTRRLHPGSSSQNVDNTHWLLRYHRPGSDRPCFPFSNLMIDHSRTILRSDFAARQKCSLLLSLLRRIYWKWPLVLEEARAALSFAVTGLKTTRIPSAGQPPSFPTR